jgi:hypothetical protein
MCLDDGTTNRQPHTHSIFFGREESLEDFLGIVHTHPAILYFDQSGFLTLPFRSDEKPLRTIEDRIHRLDPVQEQVEYELLQLHTIS